MVALTVRPAAPGTTGTAGRPGALSAILHPRERLVKPNDPVAHHRHEGVSCLPQLGRVRQARVQRAGHRSGAGGLATTMTGVAPGPWPEQRVGGRPGGAQGGGPAAADRAGSHIRVGPALAAGDHVHTATPAARQGGQSTCAVVHWRPRSECQRRRSRRRAVRCSTGFDSEGMVLTNLRSRERRGPPRYPASFQCSACDEARRPWRTHR